MKEETLQDYLDAIYESRISNRKEIYIYPDEESYNFFELGIPTKEMRDKQKFKEQEEIRDNYYKLLNDT